MKNIKRVMVILIGVFYTSFSQATNGGGSNPGYEDKNVNNQLKSMEFQQWKFTPKWYYYSFHWWDNPTGLGLHASYVKTDKRNMYPLLATIATTKLNKQFATDQHKDVDKVFKQQTAEFLDREIDIGYEQTFKTKFDGLKLKMLYIISRIDNWGKRQECNKEYERLFDEIEITHKSHVASSVKYEAYLKYEHEINELISISLYVLKTQKYTHLNLDK